MSSAVKEVIDGDVLYLTFNSQGGIYMNATDFIDSLKEVALDNELLKEFLSDSENGFTKEDLDAYKSLEKAISDISEAIGRESY